MSYLLLTVERETQRTFLRYVIMVDKSQEKLLVYCIATAAPSLNAILKTI
jgi:hypothetical protein